MARRRPLDILIGILAALCALTTLAFVAHAYVKSPQNPVAAEIGFEALRVARKLPLYVDPWKGAWEDGAPPSRYYVLYTPMFPFLVGKLAALFGAPTLAGVQAVGRTIAVLSWLVVHAAPVFAAKTRDAKWITALAAMMGAGIYFVSRHAASMSPDTFATMFIVLGVLRAVSKDRVDALSAILLVTAPFIKPSCIGGIAGAALVHFALRRPGWIRSSAIGAAMMLLLAVISHLASDGAWFSNIKNSTGQPLTLTRWIQEYGSRAVVLGIPHMIVAWLAWRRKVTWLVVGPLIGSTAWATFIMAKHGSGSHYWMEPTGLGLIAIVQLASSSSSSSPAKERDEPPWIARALPFGAIVFGVLVAIVSWPRYAAEPHEYEVHAAMVRAVDAHCVRKPGDFVVSSDFELELELNGRISVPSWQTGFLARSGRFPAKEWQEDLARPEVKWLALAIDPRQPPGTSNDERVELSPFYDVLKDVVLSHYDFDRVVGGVFIFRRKENAPIDR